MPPRSKLIVLVVLVLHLVWGGAGVVSCAEWDGTRAVEWVAAACCDVVPSVEDLATGEALEAGRGDDCGACSDELLLVTGLRPETSDSSPAVPPLALAVLAEALSALDESSRDYCVSCWRAREAEATPRALRPAFLRC